MPIRPRLSAIAVALLIMLSAGGDAQARGNDLIRVMTRNQYLGADLTPIVLAQSPEEFLVAAQTALGQIAANNFPERARALAREVRLQRPDVIGLQEVYDFTLNGARPGPPFVDHLATFLDALAERGLRYDAIASVEHLDATLPVDLDGDTVPELIRILDRDVILVRRGLRARPLSGSFDAGGLCGVPIPNPAPVPPFPETLVSTVSEEGCNYTVFPVVSSPLGPIDQERGFVGIDVRVRGRDYRVVNTHLEVREPEPGNPASGIIQTLQAVELVASIRATTPEGRTVILLGDFNSAPDDLALGPIIPPYQVISDAAFTDAWSRNLFGFFDPDGFTCCQDADLANTRSLHDERIDQIFVGTPRFVALARVLGRRPQLYPLSQPPNWGSDHGGVGAKLFFPRRRKLR